MNLTAADVAICILFHEKAEQTLECVTSVMGMGAPVHLLNNASSERSTSVLQRGLAGRDGVYIHESESNLGVGRGRNRLIAETREPWLFFLDNDITVTTTDALCRLIAHVADGNEVEALVPNLYNVHEGGWADFHTLSLTSGVATFVPLPLDDAMTWFPGGASLVSRAVFDRLGLYDDHMLVGFEDYELAIRAELMGRPIRARRVRDVALRHDHRRPLAQADKAAIAERYDIERHVRSFSRIMDKHRVLLDNDWEPWVRQQLVDFGADHKHDLTIESEGDALMHARVLRAVERLCATPATRVVVYGSGKAGQAAVEMLTARGRPPMLVLDGNPARWGETLHGVPIVDLPVGLELAADAVLLASTLHAKAMWQRLYDEGKGRVPLPMGFVP